MMSKQSVIENFQTLTLHPVEVTPFSEEKKIQFEEINSITVPENLHSWLQFSNGSYLGPGGVYGIDNGTEHLDASIVLQDFPVWSEKKWIPVAGDGSGNTYVLVADPQDPLFSSVGFIDTTGGDDKITYLVASDIWCFLQFLINKEKGEKGWPFQKEYVSTNDPGILKFERLLPWNAD